jgi:hypothetical protein
MSIEAAFPLTPTISFISYGKIMFDLHAHFQECNYCVNREVAVYCYLTRTSDVYGHIFLASWSIFATIETLLLNKMWLKDTVNSPSPLKQWFPFFRDGWTIQISNIHKLYSGLVWFDFEFKIQKGINSCHCLPEHIKNSLLLFDTI